MTPFERQTLRDAALRAVEGTRYRAGTRSPLSEPADWKLQTSNSFRRIGGHGDGDVLCATKHQYDGHPDLLAAHGVLDYIVAAQPHVVLELLRQLDVAEQLLERLAEVDQRLDETDRKFRDAQVLVEQLQAAVKGLAK